MVRLANAELVSDHRCIESKLGGWCVSALPPLLAVTLPVLTLGETETSMEVRVDATHSYQPAPVDLNILLVGMTQSLFGGLWLHFARNFDDCTRIIDIQYK